MPPKNPLTAADSDITTDPGSLFTGGGSQMFANTRLETRAAKARAGEQARQRSELMPISNDLLKKLQEERAKVVSVESFILGKIENPQQLLDEFRARQIYLGYLKELESWIRARIRNQ